MKCAQEMKTLTLLASTEECVLKRSWKREGNWGHGVVGKEEGRKEGGIEGGKVEEEGKREREGGEERGREGEQGGGSEGYRAGGRGGRLKGGRRRRGNGASCKGRG